MFRIHSCPPLRTLVSPELASSIAVVFYEILEFSIGDSGLGDHKRSNLNFVCHLFVIKDEASFWNASESELAARYFCVTCQVIVGLS